MRRRRFGLGRRYGRQYPMPGTQILVVDDNETQSMLVGFLLTEAGHSVRTAESAEQALEILRSFSPGLILMDVQLPGMDGLELTRILRQDPVHGKTCIVALTAYTGASDLERARDAGCDGNIVKPIDTATFTRLVARYMDRDENVEGNAEANVPRDSHDLLAELRNTFLAEGLEQCGAILRDLALNEGAGPTSIERVLHRWAGLGGTLGFPAISREARKIETLLGSVAWHTGAGVEGGRNSEKEALERAVETARRQFMAAARTTPKLPLALIAGLRDAKIGLVDFPEEEANRIRTAARRAGVQVIIEQIASEDMEEQTGYDALIVNQCAISAQAAGRRPQLSVPAVFIGSRSSLQSLSKLPARAFDFLIAPWDAEEVLIRVYRLIRKAEPSETEPDDKKGARPRVLVVDDDPAIVAMVADMLQQFDMDCDIARSGEQALEAVHRRLPDAIVLDVNMLDLDGFAVLQRLRRNMVTKDIPVLLLTARGQQTDIVQGFGSGADDYVIKPFKPLDLVKRVDKLITKKTTARAS